MVPKGGYRERVQAYGNLVVHSTGDGQEYIREPCW